MYRNRRQDTWSVTGIKECIDCQIEKQLDDFYSRICNGKRYLQARCKDCTREHNWEQRYGITKTDYEELLVIQNGVCAICHRTNKGSALCVDHCHATGKVRGLLCGTCNRAIGWLGDNAATVRAAAEYLEKR